MFRPVALICRPSLRRPSPFSFRRSATLLPRQSFIAPPFTLHFAPFQPSLRRRTLPPFAPMPITPAIRSCPSLRSPFLPCSNSPYGLPYVVKLELAQMGGNSYPESSPRGPAVAVKLLISQLRYPPNGNPQPALRRKELHPIPFRKFDTCQVTTRSSAHGTVPPKPPVG
jgi:hypothetical protein